MRFALILACFSLFSAGCSSTRSLEKIEIGMSQQEVTQELGDPVFIDTDGESYFYVYRSYEDLWFQYKNGLLVQSGRTGNPAQRSRWAQAGIYMLQGVGQAMQDQP